ncbi:MAG TPA: hypothetical protein PLM07_03950 [Candidatus Rifleibacterium sp.]|nr:hypothetical protein [Candidatus Rifleibacterium sp.]HPT45038.1 hypothetical protein [Candidatus Rifleibacterium sp.]
MAKAVTVKTKGDFECLVKVKHDGIVYMPGDAIDLSADQARSLIVSGAIKPNKTLPASTEKAE